MKMAAGPLVSILIRGICREELPIPEARVGVTMLLAQDFLLPPMQNTIFTRDRSCWI